MVNPATTKRNKENRDNIPSKNDPKDALVIADSVSRGFYNEYTRQSQVFQRLRTIMRSVRIVCPASVEQVLYCTLTRDRWLLTTQLTRRNNQVQQLFSVTNPELKRAFKKTGR
ncbi:hypothetical protein J2T18_002464 [Paenibacillus polymyxa]|uniref:hypothetical protein n=1 Tax=Paenibacillus polymyxa TaxID=1406 RepID=UPI00278ED51B|nr:hypothetical protein [Paenibacillus polymyxa]